MSSQVVVTDNPTAERFEARIDGTLVGIADYELSRRFIVFTHTEVEPAFEGQGVASTLIRHALDQVRADGLRTVIPICPFVRALILKHPEYRTIAYLGPRQVA